MKTKRELLSIAACTIAAAFLSYPVHAADHTPVFSSGEMGTAPTEAAVSRGKLAPGMGSEKMSGDVLAEALQGLLPTTEQLRQLKPPGGNGAETVIQWDTRQKLYTRDYPTRAVALITFDGGGFCTGWFYGPNIVATAGHCVHSGRGGNWRTGVRVYPGYDSSAGGAIYGVYTAKWLASVVGWVNNSDEQYDYGVIKLTRNSNVGWFGVTTAIGVQTTLQGYPDDKPHFTQWVAVDRVRATTERQIFYQNDTFGGMSGSPVWDDRNGPYGFAIHAYGLHGAAPHSNNNHGTRIVAAVFNNLVNWKNAP